MVSKPCTEAILFTKIQQHLGVRYCYAASCDRASAQQTDWLTPAALAVIPTEWIARLDFAARSANDSQILQLLEEIPADHSALQAAIAQLIS